ncbi:MAG TPA: LysM domain-containing protein, partial [Roseiflexaceae bacterium]|nr:LysM domain-containing protein [Roseiflexaceae bacterium]
MVVPGDTLWGISQRYTDSPWRWPELWGMNKEQIRNPHLIYPGAVLLLDRARGTLSLAGPGGRAPAGAAGRGGPPSGSARLSPRVRAETLARQEIPS